MSSPTVPTPAPDPHDDDRVAILIRSLPYHHQDYVYSPACRPLPHPTPGSVALPVREYVYARDNLTCFECGDGPLPRCGSLVPLEPSGRLVVTRTYASLDHIIERRNGGCHHAHNLRVSCSSCNPRRSNIGPEAAKRREAAHKASADKRRRLAGR